MSQSLARLERHITILQWLVVAQQIATIALLVKHW